MKIPLFNFTSLVLIALLETVSLFAQGTPIAANSGASTQAGTQPFTVQTTDITAGSATDFAATPTLNPDGSITLTWPATTGAWYQVEVSSDLAQWDFLGRPLKATATTMNWTDDGSQTGTLPLTVPKRFYRARDWGVLNEPTLFFDFNAGEGTSAYSIQSYPAELLMLNATQQPVSLYGNAGSGLTGKPGDFALDFGMTTLAMGTKGGTGGMTRFLTAQSGGLGAVTSFTVTGWFNVYSQLDGQARIVEYTDPQTGGFLFYAGGTGVLSLSVKKTAISIPTNAQTLFKENITGQWVFFAVTYDSSKTTGNVVFYGGTPTRQPQAVATVDLNVGKPAELTSNGYLLIGNNSSGIRSFHGKLDNIAIYSSVQDSTGALSPQQIQEVYQTNLAITGGTERPLIIALIGDSTVSEYTSDSLKRGWGQMLRELTTPGVLYLNEAVPGTSTKTFPTDRWQKILTAKADFVLIQFGHNDSHAPGLPESTDAATDYRDNLRRYVTQARGASSIPVLVTPPHRRQFSSSGLLTTELAAYADAMKAVAQEMNVPLIDLYEKSGQWLQSIGYGGSGWVTVDGTHFTKDGATEIAKFVAERFRYIDPRLGEVLK